jgi:hypothetical protein
MSASLINWTADYNLRELESYKKWRIQTICRVGRASVPSPELRRESITCF